MEVHTYGAACIAVAGAYSDARNTAVVQRTRDGQRKVARLARRLKRGENDKDHHLLLVFFVGDPRRQQRPSITMIQLQTTDWNVVERKDVEKEQRRKKEMKKRVLRTRGFHISHHHFRSFFPLRAGLCYTCAFL